jgi:hypothetical protein
MSSTSRSKFSPEGSIRIRATTLLTWLICEAGPRTSTRGFATTGSRTSRLSGIAPMSTTTSTTLVSIRSSSTLTWGGSKSRTSTRGSFDSTRTATRVRPPTSRASLRSIQTFQLDPSMVGRAPSGTK